MALGSLDQLLVWLRAVLDDKDEQGHDTSGLRDRLIDPLTSVDTGLAMAEAAARLPLRDDWPYDEPSDLAAIREAADRDRRRRATGTGRVPRLGVWLHPR